MQVEQANNPFDYSLIISDEEMRKFRALTRNLENVSRATSKMIDEFESRKRKYARQGSISVSATSCVPQSD